jgi:hypothetical protein
MCWFLANAAEPATSAKTIIKKTEISSVQANDRSVKYLTKTLVKVINANAAMTMAASTLSKVIGMRGFAKEGVSSLSCIAAWVGQQGVGAKLREQCSRFFCAVTVWLSFAWLPSQSALAAILSWVGILVPV